MMWPSLYRLGFLLLLNTILIGYCLLFKVFPNLFILLEVIFCHSKLKISNICHHIAAMIFSFNNEAFATL